MPCPSNAFWHACTMIQPEARMRPHVGLKCSALYNGLNSCIIMHPHFGMHAFPIYKHNTNMLQSSAPRGAQGSMLRAVCIGRRGQHFTSTIGRGRLGRGPIQRMNKQTLFLTSTAHEHAVPKQAQPETTCTPSRLQKTRWWPHEPARTGEPCGTIRCRQSNASDWARASAKGLGACDPQRRSRQSSHDQTGQ